MVLLIGLSWLLNLVGVIDSQTQLTTIQLFKAQKTWNDAVAFCSGKSMNLLEVRTKTKADALDWISTKTVLWDNKFQDSWIGLHDPDPSTKYGYSWAVGCTPHGQDGTSWSDWYTNEPLNYNSNKCVKIVRQGSGFAWRAESCNQKKMVFCESVGGDCTFHRQNPEVSLSGLTTVDQTGVLNLESCKFKCSIYKDASGECWGITFTTYCEFHVGSSPITLGSLSSSSTFYAKKCFVGAYDGTDDQNSPDARSDPGTGCIAGQALVEQATTTTTTTTTTTPTTTSTTTTPSTTSTTTTPTTTTATTTQTTTTATTPITTTTAPTTTTATTTQTTTTAITTPTTASTTTPTTTTAATAVTSVATTPTTVTPATTTGTSFTPTTTVAPTAATGTTTTPATTDTPTTATLPLTSTLSATSTSLTTTTPTPTSTSQATSVVTTTPTSPTTSTGPSSVSPTAATTTTANGLTMNSSFVDAWSLLGYDICSCNCNSTDNKTLEEKIEEIVLFLTVDKSKTSKSIRKKISAPDNRPSAQNIGFLGIALLVATWGLLLLADSTYIFQLFKFICGKKR